jgi:hypothetical protein
VLTVASATAAAGRWAMSWSKGYDFLLGSARLFSVATNLRDNGTQQFLLTGLGSVEPPHLDVFLQVEQGGIRGVMPFFPGSAELPRERLISIRRERLWGGVRQQPVRPTRHSGRGIRIRSLSRPEPGWPRPTVCNRGPHFGRHVCGTILCRIPGPSVAA